MEKILKIVTLAFVVLSLLKWWTEQCEGERPEEDEDGKKSEEV